MEKIEIKIFTSVFHIVSYECETWSVMLWEEHRRKQKEIQQVNFITVL